MDFWISFEVGEIHSDGQSFRCPKNGCIFLVQRDVSLFFLCFLFKSIIVTDISFQLHVSLINYSHLNMMYKGVSNMFCVFNQTNKQNAEMLNMCMCVCLGC